MQNVKNCSTGFQHDSLACPAGEQAELSTGTQLYAHTISSRDTRLADH
jgi:hypothetical protein